MSLGRKELISLSWWPSVYKSIFLLLLLTALWPFYLASSQLFSGKFSAGKDSQVQCTQKSRYMSIFRDTQFSFDPKFTPDPYDIFRHYNKGLLRRKFAINL